jgi:prepilin-type N-terminal cleavage/methylation domain-containing protein
MRSSVGSTRPASGGFSLLEVTIATSLFSVVMIVALTTMKESTDATNIATTQADLRRTGDIILRA